MKTIDRIDEKLLVLLQANNRLTYAEMAEQVAVSTSSCRRRVEALRRSGAIIADVSIVNPEISGTRLKVIALVTLERDTLDGHAAFRRSMRDLPQVTQCHYVAGTFDYVVHFSLSSMEQYDLAADRYFTANRAVKRAESLVVLKDVKTAVGGSLPTGEAP